MQAIFKNHEKMVPVRGPVRESASVSDLDPDPGFQDEKFSSFLKQNCLSCHRKSLQPIKENMQLFQNMKYLKFFFFEGNFFTYWLIRIRANPEPGTDVHLKRLQVQEKARRAIVVM
jgi:hypothetical protein